MTVLSATPYNYVVLLSETPSWTWERIKRFRYRILYIHEQFYRAVGLRSDRSRRKKYDDLTLNWTMNWIPGFLNRILLLELMAPLHPKGVWTWGRWTRKENQAHGHCQQIRERTTTFACDRSSSIYCIHMSSS